MNRKKKSFKWNDSNGIPTHNHLVRKRLLDHLASSFLDIQANYRVKIYSKTRTIQVKCCCNSEFQQQMSFLQYHLDHLNIVVLYMYYVWLYICQINST